MATFADICVLEVYLEPIYQYSKEYVEVDRIAAGIRKSKYKGYDH